MSSIGTFSEGGLPSQDFDLNLAPIIDCFTVLIAFVMISTAFASVGILDAGVAAGGEKAAQTDVPPVRVAVQLASDHRFVVKVTGKENHEYTIPAAAGSWNGSALTAQLDQIRKKWWTVSGAVVSADNSVSYDDVVRSMDQVRRTFPAVMLGGL